MTSAALTAKQSKFVQEYLVDGNGARAAVAAGYGVAGSRVAACRLLTRANVQEALHARQAADATRLSIRREDVLAGLLEAVATAREQRNSAGMVAGLREISRLMGLYPDKHVQVDVAVGGAPRSMERLSDSELLEIIERGKAGAYASQEVRAG